MRPPRLVAQDERRGLGPMQESQRHPSERGMKQRALAFDQVPAVVAARRLFEATEDKLGLPCTDPVAFGVAPILDKLCPAP